MKKICIFTSSRSLQDVISYSLFDKTLPVRSNGGLFGFWGNNQVLVVLVAKGKVNVAVAVSEVLHEVKPDAVVVAGTAASLSGGLLPGSIIAGSHFCYYDVCYGNGTEFGRYPAEPTYYYSNDNIVSRMIEAGVVVHQGLVLSGDNVVESSSVARKVANRFKKARAIDMDSAVAAQVCYKNSVPFVSIKVIDSVPVMDEKSKSLYPQFRMTDEDLTGKLFVALNKTMESL